jgi:hypothetical protein
MNQNIMNHEVTKKPYAVIPSPIKQVVKPASAPTEKKHTR